MTSSHKPSHIATARLATVLVVMTLSAAAAAAASAVPAPICTHSSGVNKAALVELYTSEGCSSCPSADKQLSRLQSVVDADARLVPLALHVPYWDDIGWKDPYGQPAFEKRQRALVNASGQRTVYTPQFFVSSNETRDWPGGLREKVRRINAQPAPLTIDIHASASASTSKAVGAAAGVTLQSTVTARQGGSEAGAELYLALTESGLVSQVKRGENSGVTLHHDHVVRAWLGPYKLPALAAGASFKLDQSIALPTTWQRDKLTVVAFVQAPRLGPVVQALQAPLASACLATS
ncbi:MAG: hypothetical protein RL375_673 [Pseudomonadota bacterium]